MNNLLHLGTDTDRPFTIESDSLTTHGVILGMTGSGKTGLAVACLEELALAGVPCVVVDQKGDLARLMLAFPGLRAKQFEPWVDVREANAKSISCLELAEKTAALWRKGIERTGQDVERVERYGNSLQFRLYTPGQRIAPISVLSNLDRPEDNQNEAATDVATSLISMMARISDPERVRTYLSACVLALWERSARVSLEDVAREAASPSFGQIGVQSVDDYVSATDRRKIARALNTQIASPSFKVWTSGPPLDPDSLLWQDGNPCMTILSVAGLGEKDREFFLTTLLNNFKEWMLRQSGSNGLRCMLYIDEAHGVIPPNQQPPTKKPALSILKQGRAFGLGLMLATQNPADVDYKALSNIGTWLIGRLNTDQDRSRLLDGLSNTGKDRAALDKSIAALDRREFVCVSARDNEPRAFAVRWCLSFIGGPLSSQHLERLAENNKDAPMPVYEPATLATIEEEDPDPRQSINYAQLRMMRRRMSRQRKANKERRWIRWFVTVSLLSFLPFSPVQWGAAMVAILILLWYVWLGGPIRQYRNGKWM